MKILIADDEALVRSSIKRILVNIGYNDIVEASDGIESYEMIQNSKPSIVLADIRMPGIDGLNLLEKTQKNIGNILFIFISGYDLFQYAQQAVSLGAFSYLLKPIDEIMLKDVINRALQKITSKSEEKELFENMKEEIQLGISSRRRLFIQKIVQNSSYSQEYIKNKLDQLDITFDKRNYIVIYISIDDYTILTLDMSLSKKEGLKALLEQKCLDFFSQEDIHLIAFEMEDGVGLLINFNEQEINILKTSVYLHKRLISHNTYTITIGLGTIEDALHKMHLSYSSAVDAIMQRISKGNNQVISINESTLNNKNIEYIDFEKEQLLKKHFSNCDIDFTLEIIKSLYHSYSNYLIDTSTNIKNLNFQLVMLIFKFLNQMHINAENLLGDELILYSQLNACSSIDSIIYWFRRNLELCFEEINSIEKTNDSNLILKAKNYIHSNFNKEISLTEVASYIHLSPPYFSKIFKQEIGQSFSSYIITYRINTAKQLLAQETYKVKHVGELVGFTNTKYFYKIFKKNTGVTPSEYRNNLINI